jgi:hypothetical protein
VDEGRKKMRKIFRFFISMTTFAFVAVATAVPLPAQVVINEFLADPAMDWDGDGAAHFRDDEWVEIVNLGDAPVDLSGYRLADGEEYPVWRHGFSGLLGQGEVLVVYGSDSRAWEESNGFPVYGLSLNNAGDMIRLYRVGESDTLLVDSVSYGDHAADDDRSVGRPSDSPAVWEIYDAFNPCNDSCDPAGNGCAPTPGAPNACTTGTGSDSWSNIKNRHRG